MNSMKKYMMAVSLMVLSVMTAVAQDVENPVGKYLLSLVLVWCSLIGVIIKSISLLKKMLTI